MSCACWLSTAMVQNAINRHREQSVHFIAHINVFKRLLFVNGFKSPIQKSFERSIFLQCVFTLASLYCSYCSRKDCRWNDTTTAETNYLGLRKFFEEFDEFKNREFYIAGESYGGMYDTLMC